MSQTQGNSPKQTIQHPNQSQHPPQSRISSDSIPAQYHIRRERRPVNERGEQDQNRGRHIVGELEEDDLADDF